MAVRSVLRILNPGKRRQPVIFSCLRFDSTSANLNILKSPQADTEIPRVSISEWVFSNADKFGNLIATECAVTGRRYTYAQLHKYAYNLAGALRKKLKLNKGDMVGILLPNSPEYSIVALGIVRGGMVVTTFNPIYTAEEIARQMVDSDTKAIITATNLFPVAKAAMNLNKKVLPVLTANTSEGQSTPAGAINLKEMFEQDVDISDIAEPGPDDLAIMPYSSGTTGLPKGVELTHFNIVSNLRQISTPEINYFQEATQDHQDIIPAVLPQFHIYGITVTLLMTIVRGCKNICLPRFEPKLFIETLVKHRPTVLFVVPPLVIFLSSQDAVKSEYLSTVRNVVSGAAPLGAADEEKFVEKVKKDIYVKQGFGMTEASPVIALTETNKRATPGSSGPPIPNTEIVIVDSANPHGSPLGPNQTGEVMLRGPQVMKGYHNKPKETEEAFVNGWLRTGDIGFYDEAGCLTITDRLKELIKVKGFQVPPAELEEVIREYPGVLEVGVIGVPHATSGEVPRAYIVVKPGVQVDEKKVQDFVGSKVASYKQLKGGVSIVDNIPRNPSGKILRRQLKELYDKQQA